MTADVLSWRRAVSVSCAAHLVFGLCFGAMVQSWPPSEAKEKVIAVELAVEEPATEADAPLSALPGLAAAAKPDGAAVSAPRAAPPRPAPAALPGSLAAPAIPDRAVRSAAAAGSDSAAAPFSGTNGSGGSGGAATGSGGAQGGASGFGSAGGADSGGGGGGGAGRLAAVNGFAARVEAHKKYPYMALKRNLEGRPVVYVELDAGGELAALSLSASSGVDSLDKAAVEAVRSACPYRHGLGARLAMEVPVQYRLSGG